MAKQKLKEYATYDIETSDWNKWLVGCVYDGKQWYKANDARELINLFVEHACKGRVYYAHAGGKFDIKFLLEILLTEFEVKLKHVAGSIVKASVYKRKHKLFELRDSYNLLTAPLYDLARDYKTFSRIKTCTLSDYAAMKSKRGTLTKSESTDAYVSLDCEVLYDVLMQYKAMTGNRGDFAMTCAGESMKEWRTLENAWDWRIHSQADEHIRKSYYGGRVEVFEREIWKVGNFYDVVSMYPYVMRHRLYPKGYYTRTTKYKSGFLGIYYAQVNVPQMNIPPLPFRTDEGRLIFPCGTWDAWYTSAELEHLKDCGGSFHVYDGYYWLDSGNPFSKYIDKYFEIKKEAAKCGDTAKKHVAKLRMNTLYGKFGQRRKFRKIISNPTRDEILDNHLTPLFDHFELYTTEQEEKNPFTMVHIASFVTSYARIQLHKYMLQCKNVYYCDTDSIATDTKLETSPELGGLELVTEFDFALFLYPKCYVVCSGDKVKIKAKGFDSSKLTLQDFKDHYYNGGKLRTKRDGLVGFFASSARGLKFTDKVDMTREASGAFTKRELIGKSKTKPLNICIPMMQ